MELSSGFAKGCSLREEFLQWLETSTLRKNHLAEICRAREEEVGAVRDGLLETVGRAGIHLLGWRPHTLKPRAIGREAGWSWAVEDVGIRRVAFLFTRRVRWFYVSPAGGAGGSTFCLCSPVSFGLLYTLKELSQHSTQKTFCLEYLVPHPLFLWRTPHLILTSHTQHHLIMEPLPIQLPAP